MATGRELVEAHSFGRRRLVTAFVCGAPGGRDVEPARPGRTIAGGLALAALLVAGAAVGGHLAPRTPADWSGPGLVISQQSGAAFVITEPGAHPVLRPVPNLTSARLILGAGIEPRIVPQAAIDRQTIGPEVGIRGAPAGLATPSRLIDSGWTACTGERRGIRVDLAEAPAVAAAPGGGFVVQSRGAYYLIARSGHRGGATPRAHRYRLPAEGDQQDNLLDALGVPVRADAVRVPAAWLALFPAGGDLDFASFGITGAGRRAPGAGSSGLPATASVGDLVTTGAESLLLTRAGPVRLDPFALAVYRHTGTPTGLPAEVPLAAAPGGPRASAPYAAAHWPDTLLRPVSGAPCARLVPAPGEQPGVELATDPADEASAADVPAGARSTRVEAGRGAYVLAGGWDDTDRGSPVVVDASGTGYPLGPDAAGLLGYAGHPAPVVPAGWVGLFARGPTLSREDALCPPDRAPTSPSACADEERAAGPLPATHR